MNDTPWTPQRIEQLTILRREGRSFDAIGKAMGITRNAAIGKYQRLRQASGHVPAPRKRILESVSEGKPEFCKELRYNTTPKRALTTRRNLPGVSKQGIGFLMPVLAPPPPRIGPAVGILDTTGCQWPTGYDEAVPGRHTFCDAAKAAKGPYCPFPDVLKVAKPEPAAKRKRFIIPTSLLRIVG